MDFLRGAAPGTRVVVRYRIDDGVTDALGYLISLSTAECTVRTRRGDVVVPLARVEAAKEVPPPPAPRAPRYPAG
ncbi:hypothetical protein SAMN04489742_3349 [Arthrobacter crystallopoietes]|uniref:Histone acetyltransferase Rv0428c-like SH3 domain-containing protein n=1 Tax=Crystallibacter crystallopoietes TaxID=37928 RepID=A0A1H1FAY8_9MICC|nr:hypothetical protein SAMN04489742_3349 [Arthrobacter crystallopoietes]